ncbi:MAG: polyribonucleotide nucleotidyltransferase [Deltaproteobacteria bacterium]|nr:polyribonucleotide nucleotidyltransferase [Deltaproteobacteria bacterium]
MTYVREGVLVGGKELTIETGRMAKQAGGSVVVRYGDTMVLVAATASSKPREGVDFLPLTVDYLEKTSAAGKIPGGYFKREGRPTENEILTCRLIDRPCRPLFPKGWRFDTQVIALVLSADRENPSDVLALTGASAAIYLSDMHWDGPVAGVRVGRIDGQLVINPTIAEQERSDLNFVVACSRDAIVMVEGGAKEVPETVVIDALFFAHREAQPILDLQEKLRAAVGKARREFVPSTKDESLVGKVKELTYEKVKAAMALHVKQERYGTLGKIYDELGGALCAEGAPFHGREKEVVAAYEDVKKKHARLTTLDTGLRIDGRRTFDIRPISSEVSVLPRTHGSGLFTRGETQALVTTTLGTQQDVQRIDALTGDVTKRFMLHYNFPPFSTGETKPMRGASRREIGHGYLAERAIAQVLPSYEDFPYTIRIVSEILESNGSSSMATVCGGILSLMDAGVPISTPVAGIAMGLMKEGDRVAVLSDILGDEDHLGDMDFKVCGTRNGVTALQMDIKISGLSREILEKALSQARDGRLYILDKMAETIPSPRDYMSPYAPRIYTMQVKPDRIRDIIGPGGKTIRAIVEQTGVAIDVEDDGTVSIASSEERSAQKAMEIIRGLTAEPEVGQFYHGVVKRIAEFGAFVEIMPGTDGLLHISEIALERVKRVEDVLKEGDEVVVKVISVDKQGKIRLSRKEALGQAPEVIHNTRQ